jgi:hypothetical protein
VFIYELSFTISEYCTDRSNHPVTFYFTTEELAKEAIDIIRKYLNTYSEGSNNPLYAYDGMRKHIVFNNLDIFKK